MATRVKTEVATTTSSVFQATALRLIESCISREMKLRQRLKHVLFLLLFARFCFSRGTSHNTFVPVFDTVIRTPTQAHRNKGPFVA